MSPRAGPSCDCSLPVRIVGITPVTVFRCEGIRKANMVLATRSERRACFPRLSKSRLLRQDADQFLRQLGRTGKCPLSSSWFIISHWTRPTSTDLALAIVAVRFCNEKGVP